MSQTASVDSQMSRLVIPKCPRLAGDPQIPRLADDSQIVPDLSENRPKRYDNCFDRFVPTDVIGKGLISNPLNVVEEYHPKSQTI